MFACCWYSWSFRCMTRHQNVWRRLLGLAAMFHVVINVALTCVLLYVSHLNYPGGVAIHTLHQMESKSLGILLISLYTWHIYWCFVCCLLSFFIRMISGLHVCQNARCLVLCHWCLCILTSINSDKNYTVIIPVVSLHRAVMYLASFCVLSLGSNLIFMAWIWLLPNYLITHPV